MNTRHNKIHSLFLALLLSLVIAGCAKMGSPDGGWYDEEPPYVFATSPMENAVDFHGQKVFLLFNEYIKVENAQEKIVISPPQIEQPEIKVQGKRIRVELKDSLKENTTYTIDFSDAISDNNEGNPMGNYTFTFSTGDHIDTMEVSGHVLEAETLEPIKGILVGLYLAEDFKDSVPGDSASVPGDSVAGISSSTVVSDTIFRTKPILRVSRTDGNGHFVIKGVAKDKEYRVFALEDMDGDFRFSQKSERIAFTDRILTPGSFPDTRLDTIWSDALHIKSLERVPYTHFTPDDIVLCAFTEKQTERHLLKTERKEPEQLHVYFTYGDEQLPVFTPLNFSAKEGIEYLVEHNADKDSITYWLSDSTLINSDSLFVELRYMDTDTTGVLVEKADTIEFIPRIGFEKRQKLKEEEYKKWAKEQEKKKKKEQPYETEMPAQTLEVRWNIGSPLAPNQSIKVQIPAPIAHIDTASIHLAVKQDTLWIPYPFVMEKDTVQHRTYAIRAEWTPKEEYQLEVDSFAIRDIYDRMSKATKQNIKIGTEEDYGTVIFEIKGMDGKNLIVQLLSSDKVACEVKTTRNLAEFYYIKPGEYYAKIIVDDDGDGKWTTGLYEENRQPEAVYYYPEKIEVKAKWDKNIEWNPKQKPLDQQKPAAIVKQKEEQKKTQRKNRNMERARQMGLKFLPDGTPVTEETNKK